MHERSNFPLLRLFLSFEMNFSISRPRPDYISRGIRATTGVCRHNQLYLPDVKNNNTAYHAFGKY